MSNFTLFERTMLSISILLLRALLYIIMKLWFDRVDSDSADALCRDIIQQIGKSESILLKGEKEYGENQEKT